MVLGSVTADLLFDKSSSWRMNHVLPQIEHIRNLSKQLQESPEDVIRDLEELRTACKP